MDFETEMLKTSSIGPDVIEIFVDILAMEVNPSTNLSMGGWDNVLQPN